MFQSLKGQRVTRLTTSLFAVGLLLGMGAVPGPVSAMTQFNGPLYTSILSGTTICETILYGVPGLGTTLVKNVRVESTAVVPTRATPAFAYAKRTVEMWYLPAETSTWLRDPTPYVDYARPTTVGSTNWTAPTRLISLRADWRGQIATTEKVELLDANQRVLSGGKWGPYWENEYQSNAFGYGFTPTMVRGICSF